MSWDEDDLLKTDAKSVIIEMALREAATANVRAALAILLAQQERWRARIGFVAAPAKAQPLPQPTDLVILTMPRSMMPTVAESGIVREHVRDIAPWAVTFIGIAAVVGALR